MIKNLTGKPIVLGVAIIKNVDNLLNDRPFNRLEYLAKEYQKKYKLIKIGNIAGVEFARMLFKSIKIDPTKHRPSSEALLRRAIKNKSLPKINPAVDLGNWCSLDFLLPICVYDADKIFGKITLRLGLPNESYLAINNREINLENRFVLADEKGAFGSPITDSKRTMVTTQTKNLMLVIYFHKDVDKKEMEKMLSTFIQRTIEFLGGILKEKMII